MMMTDMTTVALTMIEPLISAARCAQLWDMQMVLSKTADRFMHVHR